MNRQRENCDILTRPADCASQKSVAGLRIVVCQGSPAIRVVGLEELFDTAELALIVSMGSQYIKGSPTTVLVKHHGVVVADVKLPTPYLRTSGLLRFMRLPFLYLQNTMLLVHWLRRWPQSKEACLIGRLWTYTALGIVLRRFGMLKRVVYWAGDYYPVHGPLEIRLLNRSFQVIERWIIRHSDEVWYMTKRMADVHVTHDGSRLTKAPERLMNFVFDVHPELQNLWTDEFLHHFIYAGYIKKGMGLDVVLQAVERIACSMNDVHLHVFGHGPDLASFQAMANALGISSRVTFYGYVDDEQVLMKRAAMCAAGFAMYDLAETPHAYYAVNSKAFKYIGCGTPVIITESAGSYDDVMENGAGVSATYSVDSVIAAMHQIAGNVEAHREYRAAAQKFVGIFRDRAALIKSAAERVCRTI